MSTITTKYGVSLYYKDWGPKDGPVVTLSHGWPLSSDSWESNAFFLASNGFRVIAHDRRGHGRSSQPWEGNDMDHYADDLAAVVDTLDLRDINMVGFSTGGGEVARRAGHCPHLAPRRPFNQNTFGVITAEPEGYFIRRQ